MCGIAGFINLKNSDCRWVEPLQLMTAALSHRGPDADGHWFDHEAGVGLGHRRLSIIDLSPQGHQPMCSVSGRYELCFNGEIYNFAELREGLESSGHRFRGNSDTEVMLAAFEQHGVLASVRQFVGMFGFALWDRRERVMYLVRDRLGEKPLYYGWAGDVFLFGSELKALRAHPMWQGEIDRDAVALLMRHNYIPAPYSIYKGVYKLLPGTILTMPLATIAAGPSRAIGRPVAYWSAKEVAERGVSNQFTGGDLEAVDQLETLLRESVRQQMVCDVPLGAFLSGGVDSSMVVALMQAQSRRPVKTFTVGFNEEDYNEARHAEAVANHLGTEHTQLYVTPEEAMAVIPRLPLIYDEPFSDSSQIPTLLVSQLARRHVTVSLSGDGGDELFCGYKRYELGRDLWDKVNYLPSLPRRGLAKTLRGVPPGVWDGLFSWASPILNRYGRPGPVGDKLHKTAEILEAATPDALYHRMMSHWKETTSLVTNSRELPTAFTSAQRLADIPDFNHRMMFADTISYLPDDILVKVDRASMAMGLESRVPFLDHRIVEFAWRIPMSMKFRHGQGKWLLRQVLYRYVPRQLVERTKMGFGVPIDAWLRGPLRQWAEALLHERRLLEEGFFNPGPIRKKWAEHLSGAHNWHYYLWDVLMFQAWLEQQSTSTP
ncbi:MAG TPA: asparagine synthase (glutamine-hydrolyzing) [Blastocatellia bacterium]|jgi:asparagine synthase (glutamine-hydrolysing)